MDEKNEDSIGYAFSAITILLAACFVIVAFHVCRRRRDSSPGAAASSRGVDVKSLPTFLYRSENEESPPECAVCLSELEEGEAGRILPECKHCFHVDCIDAWLRSRGHCPLCRADCTVVSIREPAGESDGIRICCPLGPGPSSSENPVGRDHADLDRSLGQDPGCRVSPFWL